MNRTERLYYRAQCLTMKNAEKLTIAFITCNEDGTCSLMCKIWGDKPGNEKSIESVHPSIDEAQAHVDEVASQYPGTEEVILFIDNLED